MGLDKHQHQSKAYMVLTRRFSGKSLRGNKYIFVSYAYDFNTILIVPLKNRPAKEITNAYHECFNKIIQKYHATKITYYTKL